MNFSDHLLRPSRRVSHGIAGGNRQSGWVTRLYGSQTLTLGVAGHAGSALATLVGVP